MREPKTLKEAIEHYANPDNCLRYMMARRWPDGVVTCPICGNTDVHFIPSRRLWECKTKHPKRQFSVKVGTVMEDSPLGLDKWLTAAWMISNCKNGVSSYEISRAIGVTQKSAWFMAQRLRLAMQTNPMGTKIGSNDGGECEADECFIGPKPKNMHKSRRTRYEKQRMETGRARAIVMGILDRDARQMRAMVVPNVKRDTLQTEILKNVKYGSTIYTDDAVAYDKLHWRYVHETVNHAVEYVKGRVHTNGMENFWSLLKRGLTGTYVAVEPFHLFRYVDEQVFRYNNRATKDNPLNDYDRFMLATTQMIGKRLTYKELTGKTGSEANA